MPTYKVNPKNKDQESQLVSWLKSVGIKFAKPRKPGGGQKKGRGFEKEVAIDLSKWFTNGERDDIFYCSSGSGSRFTVRKKRGKDTANSCGDIGLLDPIGQPFLNKFSMEAKRGYNDKLDVLSIVDSKNKAHTIFEWIEKVIKEIGEANRPYFIIVIRRDQKQRVVVVSSLLLTLLHFDPDKEVNLYSYDDFGTTSFSIVSYDEFFEFFKPEMLEEI